MKRAAHRTYLARYTSDSLDSVCPIRLATAVSAAAATMDEPPMPDPAGSSEQHATSNPLPPQVARRWWANAVCSLLAFPPVGVVVAVVGVEEVMGV